MDSRYKMSRDAELSWKLVSDIQILNKYFWGENSNIHNIKVQISLSVSCYVMLFVNVEGFKSFLTLFIFYVLFDVCFSRRLYVFMK